MKRENYRFLRYMRYFEVSVRFDTASRCHGERRLSSRSHQPLRFCDRLALQKLMGVMLGIKRNYILGFRVMVILGCPYVGREADKPTNHSMALLGNGNTHDSITRG